MSLAKCTQKLIQMRNEVLYELASDTMSIEKIKEIGFRLSEDILNLRIMIRELKGLNIDCEIEQLKRLYNRDIKR